MLNNKLNGTVTKIANAIEENNFFIDFHLAKIQ